jgi:hypothetical protein
MLTLWSRGSLTWLQVAQSCAVPGSTARAIQTNMQLMQIAAIKVIPELPSQNRQIRISAYCTTRGVAVCSLQLE